MNLNRYKLGFGTLLILTAVVMGLQNDRVGFEPGHHGWVTSDHLAIILRSSPANLGVGYIGETLHADGSIDHTHFNRAPFFFEALVHLVLSPLQDDLAAYVMGVRQILNGVYVITLVVVFFLARLWLASDLKAMFATFMLGSGYYFLEYKDLVEPNRLGALAMFLAIYAIADFERRRRVRHLVGLAAICSCMGEAAPACFVFLAWFLLVGSRFALQRQSLKVWFRMPALLALMVSGGVAASLIGYNVLAEARMRSVAIADTGILESAQRRLGGAGDDVEARMHKSVAWENYSTVQVRRIFRGFLPHIVAARGSVRNVSPWYASVFLLLGVLACVRFARRKADDFSDSIWVAVGAGVLYLLVMRRLIAFHDFTLTNIAGFGLVVWCYVADRVIERHVRILTAFSAALLAVNLFTLRLHHNQMARIHNPVTAEFQTIRGVLGPGSKRIFIDVEGGSSRDLIPGAPAAPYFYFHGHLLTQQIEQAEFVVKKARDRSRESLTETNQRYFLYRGGLTRP